MFIVVVVVVVVVDIVDDVVVNVIAISEQALKPCCLITMRPLALFDEPVSMGLPAAMSSRNSVAIE